MRATTQVEAVAGEYQRLYIPSDLSRDSQYPFTPGDNVRLQVLETENNRPVVAIVPYQLEVCLESSIELQESSTETQLDLELEEAEDVEEVGEP